MQVLKAITRLVPDPYNPNPLAAELDPRTPPVPVGLMPLGILLGERFEPSVRVVGFDTAEAEGT